MWDRVAEQLWVTTDSQFAEEIPRCFRYIELQLSYWSVPAVFCQAFFLLVSWCPNLPRSLWWSFHLLPWLCLPNPSFHELNLINRGSLKSKLPSGKITTEKKIFSSVFQEKINPESHVSAQKAQTAPYKKWHPRSSTNAHTCGYTCVNLTATSSQKLTWRVHHFGALSQLQTFLTDQT